MRTLAPTFGYIRTSNYFRFQISFPRLLSVIFRSHVTPWTAVLVPYVFIS